MTRPQHTVAVLTGRRRFRLARTTTTLVTSGGSRRYPGSVTERATATGPAPAGSRSGRREPLSDPVGDRTDMIVAAIAKEVAYRRDHGLAVYVDRGTGIQDVGHVAVST